MPIVSSDTPTLTRKAMWERHAAIWAKDSPMSDAERKAASFALHHEYTMQFVTPGVVAIVKRHFDETKIKASLAWPFNPSEEGDSGADFQLQRWDRLADSIRHACNTKRLKEAQPGDKPNTFLWSLSDAVSIAKAAAHDMWKEGR